MFSHSPARPRCPRLGWVAAISGGATPALLLGAWLAWCGWHDLEWHSDALYLHAAVVGAVVWAPAGALVAASDSAWPAMWKSMKIGAAVGGIGGFVIVGCYALLAGILLFFLQPPGSSYIAALAGCLVTVVAASVAAALAGGCLGGWIGGAFLSIRRRNRAGR